MPQTFTVQEAEALLPQLKPLVTRMQELKARYDQILEPATVQSEKVKGNGNPASAGATVDRDAVQSITNEINAVVEEIRSHGCEVKDLNLGLLDFPTIMEGREVYLCWKAGEPRIEWWHELHTGYASRQRLARPQDS